MCSTSITTSEKSLRRSSTTGAMATALKMGFMVMERRENGLRSCWLNRRCESRKGLRTKLKFKKMTLSLEQILRSVDERATLVAYAKAARDMRLLDEELHPVR